MDKSRVPILHIAPGVDIDDQGRAAVAWFAQIDRSRWAPSLIVTEPSPNRLLSKIEPNAEELWELPEMMEGFRFPDFILSFIQSRGVKLVHISSTQIGFDLLPDMASLTEPPAAVAYIHRPDPGQPDYLRYAARRYGNLIDVFSVGDERLRQTLVDLEIPPSKIELSSGSNGDERGAISADDRLYKDLLGARPAGSRWRIEGVEQALAPTQKSAAVARFPREPLPERTVGVGVPCFRHGIHLDECIHSIKSQFLQPDKIVIVDDGSDDPETQEALRRWERDSQVTVVRQPENLGPSAARNRALELFDTNYALWIDADDRLLPGALDSMVAKLETASEAVGFVYPHAQHVGNRTDFQTMPAYNKWLLLQHNICPSPSLFDLRAFAETGIRYPEDLQVGHEDWDLILQLAERDIEGVPADGPTFLYRKQGFSRVHAVDYGPDDFHRIIEARHPSLYGNEAEIKAECAPALSIVLIEADGHWPQEKVEQAATQSCIDFELLAGAEFGGAARVVEGASSMPLGYWVQAALRAARGRWVCLLTPATAELLSNRTFVERLLRSFRAQDGVTALALSSPPGVDRHAFALLSEAERRAAEPIGLAFERPHGAWMPTIEMGGRSSFLGDLVIGLQAYGIVQWRFSPGAKPISAEATIGDPSSLDLNYRRPSASAELASHRLISAHEPLLPGLPAGTVRRWSDSPSWIPAGTQPLARHKQVDGSVRMTTNHRDPPPGFELEFDLGVTRLFAAPDTMRLVQRSGTFQLSEEQGELTEGKPLGYVEQQQLPLCERLELREMHERGERVLVVGSEDPLFEKSRPLANLGWLVQHPIPPRGELFRAEPWRARPLYREVDLSAGRHRYAVDSESDGSGVVVLGSMLSAPGRDLVALRLRDDGRLVSDLAQPGRATRDPRKLGRWLSQPPSPTVAEHYWSSPTRVRHLLRRWTERRLTEDEGTTLGWLHREVKPGSQPLISTTHLVTGDQLVTCDPDAAIALGYRPDGILGFILAEAAEAPRQYSVPWAGPYSSA